ncbi:MAG: aspartate aminotransferase family protein [FCB group bacterium]
MERTLIEREKEVIFQTYKRHPIIVERAEGCRIYDAEGNSYLDFLGGIAVNALGHSHPKIIEAICEQSKKFMHLSNYYYQEPQIKLAEKLKEISGYSRVFFSNSGTEAVEGAIKLARRWGNLNNKTEMYAFSGGFHGRTYGALSLMDKPLFKDKMGPFLPNMHVLPYNDSEELINRLNTETSALILEFVQGEGGVTTANDDFVHTIFKLKEKYNFLVIADEVQAGTGRTGKFFGFEHFNVSPDIITMGKGIGGGVPLGAILAKETLANVWEPGMHGTTYGGNALACTAGLVVLEELQNGIQTNVINVGNYLKKKLEIIKNEFPALVLEVRGLGLMQGILLNFDAAKLVAKLIEKRVITNAASGKVLRIVPPLIITNAEVDEFISALSVSLKEFV